MPKDQNLIHLINYYLVSFTRNFKHYPNNGVIMAIKMFEGIIQIAELTEHEQLIPGLTVYK